MLIILLLATTAFTAWCIYAGAQGSLRRLPRITATPVVVQLVEEAREGGVEEKQRMLDEIFSARPFPREDEVDPPTVVMDRR